MKFLTIDADFLIIGAAKIDVEADSFDEKAVAAQKAAALEFRAAENEVVSETGPERNPFVDFRDRKDARPSRIVRVVVQFRVCLANVESSI